MPPIQFIPEPGKVYDLAAKSLARTVTDDRHSYFGHLDGDSRARFPEGWRFPFVETHFDPRDTSVITNFNRVTVVYFHEDPTSFPASVELVSNMSAPSEKIELHRVENSKYWAAGFILPTRKVYRYLFLVDGKLVEDPVNPRRTVDGGANSWSFFWTDYCQKAVTFEVWEALLLQRLVRHILPFNSLESEIFLNTLNPVSLTPGGGNLYRLDLEMGAVNFIDKLLAGPECHHLASYRDCLLLINGLLRKRNPYQEPRAMGEEMFVELYRQMASGNIPGWDTSRYSNPAYFLKLLRRHTFTGAFSHPRHGGNSGAYAWDYLSERFPPFDWRGGLEPPWGTNADYRG